MAFIQTKLQAHRMHIVLGLLGVNVGEIHGNLSQMQVGVFSEDRCKVCMFCRFSETLWMAIQGAYTWSNAEPKFINSKHK